jgi:hypothetical protein
MMMRRFGNRPAVSAAILALGLSAGALGQQSAMTFFVTSTGSGKGADFGGLAGADAHCQKLAAAVGAGNHTWRAYLSASATPTSPAVNARDRIGAGPWQNAKGVMIAANVAELHGNNNLDKQVEDRGLWIGSRGRPSPSAALTPGSACDPITRRPSSRRRNATFPASKAMRDPRTACASQAA